MLRYQKQYQNIYMLSEETWSSTTAFILLSRHVSYDFFLINWIFSYKFRNRAPDIYKNNTMYIAPFSFCYTYSFLSIFYIVMTHVRSRFWAFHCTFTEEIFNGKLHFLCSVFSISSYQSCLKSSLLKFQI